MRFRNQVDVEFPENQIVLITGQNGAGKTSLLDAVCIALYGRTYRTSGRQESGYLKVNDLVSLGYNGAAIRVAFENHGRKYVVTRKIGRATSSGELWEDGLQKAIGEKVYDYVSKKAVGLDWEGFRKSSIILQGEMSALTAMLPTDRRKALAKLFGLESYDGYEEVSKSKIQAEESEVKGMEDLEKLLGSEVAKIDFVKKSIDGVTEEIRLLEPHVKNLESEISKTKLDTDKVEEDYQQFRLAEEAFHGKQDFLDSLRKQIFDLDQENNKLSALKVSFPALESAYTDFKEVEKKKKELESEKAEFDERLLKVQTARAQLDSKEQSLHKQKKEMEGLQEEVAGLEPEVPTRSEVEAIAARLGKARRSLERATRKVASIDAEITSNEETILNLRVKLEEVEGKAECPVCLQPITDPKHVVAHYQREISRYEKRNLTLRESKKEAEAEARSGSQDVEELELQQREISDGLVKLSVIQNYKRKLEKLKLDIDELNADVQKIQSEISVLNQELGSLTFDERQYVSISRIHEQYRSQSIPERYAEVRMRIREEKNLLMKRSNLNDELLAQEKEAELSKSKTEKYRYAGLEYQKLRQRIEELEKTYSEGSKKQSSLLKEREMLSTSLADLEQKQVMLKENSEKKKDKERDIEVLKILRRIFREIPDRVIRRLRPYIEREGIDVISELSDNEISTISIDESSLAISAGSDGNLKPIQYFSGGQKTRINMALRIAISRILSKLPESPDHSFATMQTLFIDEGDFGNLDENGIREAANVLKRLSREFDRVIVISHVEELKDLLQGAVIEVVKTGPSESTVRSLPLTPIYEIATGLVAEDEEGYTDKLRPFEPV
jgi:exonuclease SbcC